MGQVEKGAFAVEAPPLDLPPTAAAVSRQHKRVPRWLRMSIRTATLVGLIALPTLAVKDPSFERLTQYKGFSILFASLGAFVVPLWIPLLGDVVIAFTAVIPIGLAGIWLAYGLFQACSSVIFMMLLCVAIGGGVFFLAEWLSLPVGLFSVFPTLFIVGANVFVQQPGKAWVITVMLTGLLFVASIVATTVCTVVFPEYCVDEVFRHHHEALEHLLHLAYYAMGLRPPALVRRVYSSAAGNFGGEATWKAAFRAADELPSNLQMLAVGGQGSPLLGEAASMTEQQRVCSTSSGVSVSGGSKAGGVVAAGGYSRTNIKTERSWHRVAVACQAGAKAQVGALAEVVIMAAHHKRIILPCSPLIPCAKGQLDTAGLLALRHLALSTALHIIKIYNATQPLDPGTEQLLNQLLSEAEWSHMRSSLLAALQELTDTFPMDYYPVDAPPNRQHLKTLQAAVNSLQAAWQAVKPIHQQQQQQQMAAAAAAAPAPAAAMSAGRKQTDLPQGRKSFSSSEQDDGDASSGPPVLSQLQDVSLPAAAAAAAVEAAPEAPAPVAAEEEPYHDPRVLASTPAALVLARMNTIHLIKLLQELIGLLEQLYDVAQEVSQHVISCKCC